MFGERVVAEVNGPEMLDATTFQLLPASINFGTGGNIDIAMNYDFKIPRKKEYLDLQHRISASGCGDPALRQLIMRVDASGPKSEEYVHKVYDAMLKLGFE